VIKLLAGFWGSVGWGIAVAAACVALMGIWYWVYSRHWPRARKR
jgi:hypothetical protein